MRWLRMHGQQGSTHLLAAMRSRHAEAILSSPATSGIHLTCPRCGALTWEAMCIRTPDTLTHTSMLTDDSDATDRGPATEGRSTPQRSCSLTHYGLLALRLYTARSTASPPSKSDFHILTNPD